MHGRRKKILFAVCLAFFIASLVWDRAFVSAQPGDASDPLVSKSYVDGQLAEIRGMLSDLQGGYQGAPHDYQSDETGPGPMTEKDQVVAEVVNYVESVYGGLLRQAGHAAEQPGAQAAPYDVLFLETGKTLIAESGSEMILRGGSASAVTGINGLCDVTSGIDILNGSEIPLNHLLIVPASDGRGIAVVYNAYLMIKGSYRVY